MSLQLDSLSQNGLDNLKLFVDDIVSKMPSTLRVIRRPCFCENYVGEGFPPKGPFARTFSDPGVYISATWRTRRLLWFISPGLGTKPGPSVVWTMTLCRGL